MNTPTRHAITKAAMTAIPARMNPTTRQISERSAIWEGSFGTGVGICAGKHSPAALRSLHDLRKRIPCGSPAASMALRDRGATFAR